MTSSNNSTAHAVRRKLGFLKTFEEKIEALKRELERLDLAARQNDDLGGRWPTDGLERIARGLLVAEKSYRILSVSGWAKQVLTRLEAIRQSPEPPSREDLGYLKIRIEELVQLKGEEEREALEALELAEGGEGGERASVPGAEGFASGEHAAFDPSQRRKADDAVVSAGIVIRDPAVRKKVVFALRNAAFEVNEMSAGPDCVAAIQNSSPDLVVLDLDDPAPGGRALYEQLRGDPLTDSIPVLRIGLPLGRTEHDGLPKPLDPAAFVAKARALTTGAPSSDRGQGGPLSNITLNELCDFVSSEVQAGLLDAAAGEHTEERFDMPGEAFVVASIWHLVEHLRLFAVQGSQGRIQFQPGSHPPPAVNLLEADSPPMAAQDDKDFLGAVDVEDLARLADLSVVIADDDPDVLGYFKKVLEEAHMSVRTFPDGQSALVAIGENPPDLVLTDILMPELDGWELCNRLRRDYASKHIPIILLSWKDDFLQRVRELHAGADDYMLKEIDSRQILRRVARVLRPRLTLEKKLESNSVLTGRIERLGVLPLLTATMQRRPNCRLTLRENWSFFDLAVAGGELHRITRTGTDGSTLEGMPALERFLGVSSGRFSVVDSAEAPPTQFPQGTWDAVGAATERLDRLTEQVADGALVGIKRIDLDARVVQTYKAIAPPKVKGALDRLVEGEPPRALIVSGKVSPELLERLLLDLIRMGAVAGITSSTSGPPLAVDAPLIDVGPDTHSLAAEVESALTSRNSSAPKNAPSGAEKASPDSQRSREGETGIAGQVRMGSMSRGPWPAISAALLVALGAMTYLYFAESRRIIEPPQAAPTSIEAPAVSAPPRDADPVDAAKAANESTDAQDVDTSAGAPAETLTQDRSEESGPTLEEKPGPGGQTEKAPDAERPQTTHKRDEKKETESAKRESKPKTEGDSKPPKKRRDSESSRTSDSGVLAISVPSGKKGLVKVIVDGKPRGTAPVRVKLSPGLHELVLEVDGKKTMRMVPIAKGKTKRIAAKFASD